MGHAFNASYDLLDRVLTNNVTLAAGVLGPTLETYSYDGMSRVVNAQNQNSLVTRTYDSLSDILQEFQQPSGAPVRMVTASYDALGNQLQITYPGGRVIASAFDALNRPSVVLDTTGGAASGIATNYYLGRSRIEERDFGNQTATFIGYDGIGNSAGDFGVRRPIQISTESLNTFKDLDSLGFAWDPNENRTAYQNYLASTRTIFGFDAINEIVGSASAVETNNYIFDRAGNRSVVYANGLGRTYACGGNACSLNEYSTTPFGACSYDRNGNLIQALGGAQTYVYDYNNHLAQLTAGVTTTYSYDAFGRRVARNDNGNVTYYYYNGWQEIQEQSSANTATCVWGGRLDDLLETTRNGQPYYAHADDLGSIVKLTDGSGNVAEGYSYGDYGAPSFFDGSGNRMEQSAVGNPYLFAGRRLDPESGWYYDRARYLDPEVGRFTTPDPLGPWWDPLSLGNSYTYCGDNPLTYTDPMGLQGGGVRGVRGLINIVPPLLLPAAAFGANGGYALRPGKHGRTYPGHSGQVGSVVFFGPASTYRSHSGQVGNVVFFAPVFTFQSHSGQVGNVIFFGAPPYSPGAHSGQYGGVTYLCGARPNTPRGRSGQVGTVTRLTFTPGTSAAMRRLCLANAGPIAGSCPLCPQWIADDECCCLCNPDAQSNPLCWWDWFLQCMTCNAANSGKAGFQPIGPNVPGFPMLGCS